MLLLVLAPGKTQHMLGAEALQNPRLSYAVFRQRAPGWYALAPASECQAVQACISRRMPFGTCLPWDAVAASWLSSISQARQAGARHAA